MLLRKNGEASPTTTTTTTTTDDLISVHIGDVIRGHCPLSPLAASAGGGKGGRGREEGRGYFRKSLIIRLHMIKIRNEPAAKIIYVE